MVIEITKQSPVSRYRVWPKGDLVVGSEKDSELKRQGADNREGSTILHEELYSPCRLAQHKEPAVTSETYSGSKADQRRYQLTLAWIWCGGIRGAML